MSPLRFQAGGALRPGSLYIEQLHRPSAALPLCRQALVLQPEHPTIQADCAELLLASGQPTAYLQQFPAMLRHPNPGRQIALLAMAWVAARQLNDSTAARRHATELTQRYAMLNADLTWRYPGIIYALQHSGAPTARIDPLVDVLYLLEKPISLDDATRQRLQRLLQR